MMKRFEIAQRNAALRTLHRAGCTRRRTCVPYTVQRCCCVPYDRCWPALCATCERGRARGGAGRGVAGRGVPTISLRAGQSAPAAARSRLFWPCRG